MSTRQRILTQARQQLISNPSATMLDLSKQIDVGRATLYRHFPSREVLIEALAMESLDAAEAASHKAAEGATSSGGYLVRLLEELSELHEQYYFAALMPAFTENEVVMARYRQQIEQLKLCIDDAKREQFFPAHIPTAWIAHTIDAMLYARWDSVHQGNVANNDAKKLLIDTVLYGLRGGAADGNR